MRQAPPVNRAGRDRRRPAGPRLRHATLEFWHSWWFPYLAVVPGPKVDPSLGSVAISRHHEHAPPALVDPGEILAKFLRWLLGVRAAQRARISKVNSWPPMRIRSPSASMAPFRMRRPPTWTPLVDPRSLTTK